MAKRPLKTRESSVFTQPGREAASQTLARIRHLQERV